MFSWNDIWAKSATSGATSGESLADHTIQVVRRIAQLRDRAPERSAACKDPRLWHRLGLAATIHDLGKVDPRFQLVLRQGRNDHRRLLYGHRHEVLSLAWLNWILGDDPYQDRFAIASAVASHHRDHRLIKLKYCIGEAWDPAPNVPDFLVPFPPKLFSLTADYYLNEILPRTREFGLIDSAWTAPEPWHHGPEDTEIAIRSVCDNLSCWEDWMDGIDQSPPQMQRRLHGTMLRGLIVLADHAASAGIDFKSLPILSSPAQIASRLQPANGRSYFPHQEQAAVTIGHAILVAPTGSGKTEAALRWAARQYETAGGSPPTFYLLPFKASMNAMQTRIVNSITPDSPDSTVRPELVSLQHSSAIQVLYHQLMTDQPQRPVSEAEWIVKRQKNLARLHATPVRILSPYQLLRAAYQLRGHESIWTDAYRGLFIIDEIHAYDPPRIAKILEMLRFLVDHLDVRVFVMTATMPGVIADKLRNLLHHPALICADDQTFKQFRRHRLQLRSAGLLDHSIIREIASRVLRRDAVLCVTTTVGRAQQLQARLQQELSEGIKIRLLHSRFTTKDRSQKETELSELVNTNRQGKRTEHVVLVATQVVEVSLDVDFDVLFSDPAPLEALLQRFGRVNRSRRPDPHDVIVCTRIDDATPVYDKSIVRAAIEQLQLIQNCVIDETDVQKWLDDIYSGPFGEHLSNEIDRFSVDFARILKSLRPFDTNDDLERMFYEQFDGAEVIPVSLVDEYRETLESEPFRAASLTIPVSNRQLNILRRRRSVLEPTQYGLPMHSPMIVAAPYDNNTGLNLNFDPALETT